MLSSKVISALVAISFVSVYGIEIDINNADSIKTAASTIADGMVSYYKGNDSGGTPGLLPDTYYFDEAGTMFDTLIQYWHLTGDSQYNDIVTQAIQFQQGSNSDFLPSNQTKSEGNDDQSTWALAAMSAAESQLPDATSGTSYISLAKAVFNDQVARWDSQTCGGGIRWQIFAYNTGYDYKNTISNGNLFQLSSRLARYTGNSTYSDWASKIFDWSTLVGFIDEEWNVYDGSQTSTNCTSIDHLQFSNSAATYVTGAAHMYNITDGDSKWKVALDGLVNRTLDVFFPNGTAVEISCESADTCDVDIIAYKASLGNWLADTIQMAPYTSDSIMPKLQQSAQAAAAACNGGSCAESWVQPTSDNGTTGVGEDMSALSFIQALLINNAAAPATGNETVASSGSSSGTATSASSTSTASPTGTSKGKPTASTNAAAMLGVHGSLVATGLGFISWFIL